MTTDKLQDAKDLLHEHATNFVTHWMEDDGNDADDKRHAANTSDAIDKAADDVWEALQAARAMLAALKEAQAVMNKAAIQPCQNTHPVWAQMRDAIAAAEAAGIKADGAIEIEPHKVWVVTLNDRYGDSVQLFTNEAAADAAIWAYLKERWDEVHFGEMPEDLGEAIEAFGYDDADQNERRRIIRRLERGTI